MNLHPLRVAAPIAVVGALVLCLVFLRQTQDLQQPFSATADHRDHKSFARGAGHPVAQPSTAIAVSTSAGPRSQKSSETAHRASGNLPTESGLIRGGALSGASTAAALGDEKRFEAILRAMDREAAMDSDALDLTNVYRQALLRKTAQAAVPGQLASFVCGLSICAGDFRGVGSAANSNLVANLVLGDAKFPVFGYTDRHVDLGRGLYAYKFIFSVDPAANKVRLPRSPPVRGRN